LQRRLPVSIKIHRCGADVVFCRVTIVSYAAIDNMMAFFRSGTSFNVTISFFMLDRTFPGRLSWRNAVNQEQSWDCNVVQLVS
jgi:hypothetical protein